MFQCKYDAGHNYSTFKEEDEADSDDFINDQVEKINSTVEKHVKKYLDAVIGTGNYQAVQVLLLCARRYEASNYLCWCCWFKTSAVKKNPSYDAPSRG